MRKKAEFTFSPLVYAALALIILVVCIGIFFLLTKGPLAGILSFTQESEEQGERAIDDLSITIGNCNPGEDKCVATIQYVCNDNGKWERTEDDC